MTILAIVLGVTTILCFHQWRGWRRWYCEMCSVCDSRKETFDKLLVMYKETQADLLTVIAERDELVIQLADADESTRKAYEKLGEADELRRQMIRDGERRHDRIGVVEDLTGAKL